MANKSRVDVVEGYKLAHEYYTRSNQKSANSVKWGDALSRFNLGTSYPYMPIGDYEGKPTLWDNTISDLIGMVNRCNNKNPVFLEYCKTIAERNFGVITPGSIPFEIGQIEDRDLIEQIKIRGLYIGDDGKWKKKTVKIIKEEQEIDVE